jgi:hypothetical protein
MTVICLFFNISNKYRLKKTGRIFDLFMFVRHQAPAGVFTLPPPHRGGFSFFLFTCFIMTDFVIITADEHTPETRYLKSERQTLCVDEMALH